MNKLLLDQNMLLININTVGHALYVKYDIIIYFQNIVQSRRRLRIKMVKIINFKLHITIKRFKIITRPII